MSSRFYWPFDAPRQLNTHRQSSYSPGEVSPGLQRDRAWCTSVPTEKETPWRSEEITGQEGVWRVADEIFMNGGDIHRQSD